MGRPCSEPCFGLEKLREGNPPTLGENFREILLEKRMIGAFLAEVTPVSFFRLFYNSSEHTCRVLSKSEFWNKNLWERAL